MATATVTMKMTYRYLSFVRQVPMCPC